MKKILKYLFIIIMILPIFVMAETSNYDTSIDRANNYIKSDKFKDRDKYLILSGNIPYQFNGVSTTDSRFLYGGMLSEREYNLSLLNNSTYLATGIEYWTMTGNAASHYYVENYLRTKEESLKSNVRVTEFVKPEIKIKGSGSYSNPWYFDEKPIVTIRTNSETYGLIEGTYKEYTKYTEGTTGSYRVSFKLSPKPGYEYAGHDGCRLSITGGKITAQEANYVINNVLEDMDCTAMFETRTFHITLDSDKYDRKPNLTLLHFRYLKGWYTDKELTTAFSKLTTLPTKAGYSFEGYKFGENEVIDKNGNLKQNQNSQIFNNVKDTNDMKITAQWKICPVGTYSDANKPTCVACPSGYTSRQGADAITKCYIVVPAGSYLKTANSTDITQCPKNYYKINSEEIPYGKKNQCSQCPSGYETENTGTVKRSLCRKWDSCKTGKRYKCRTCHTTCWHSCCGWESSCDPVCYTGWCDSCEGGWVYASDDESTYIVTFNGNGGTPSFGSKQVKLNTKYGELPDATRAGYEFTGWKNETNAVVTANTVSTFSKNHTLTAQWKQCTSGYYSTANDTKCVACPTGYTSQAGATGITLCYIDVPAGKYIKTANDSTPTECPTGYYSAADKVLYGSTNSCTQCPAGYRDGTTIAYKTAEDKCIMNVPAGKYIKTAKDSTATSCSAGYYKPSAEK